MYTILAPTTPTSDISNDITYDPKCIPIGLLLVNPRIEIEKQGVQIYHDVHG